MLQFNGGIQYESKRHDILTLLRFIILNFCNLLEPAVDTNIWVIFEGYCLFYNIFYVEDAFFSFNRIYLCEWYQYVN